MSNLDLSHPAVSELLDLIRTSAREQNTDWQSLALVFDDIDGCSANAGFLYTAAADECEQLIAKHSESPLMVDKKINALHKLIKQQSGKRYVQMLVQLGRAPEQTQIELEFENFRRWSMTPLTIEAMKTQLKPDFS